MFGTNSSLSIQFIIGIALINSLRVPFIHIRVDNHMPEVHNTRNLEDKSFVLGMYISLESPFEPDLFSIQW